MGVVWVSGKDVEPVVYVLGSICTLLFTSPVLARYVLPDEKPVRQMAYDEILDFIAASDSNNDWKWIETNWAQEAFLKQDPRLCIRVRLDDVGIHDKEYIESWANKGPGLTSTSYWYDLSFDGALIERFTLVSLDDGKAELPLPDPGTLEVDPLVYKVGQIFDEHNTLDEYMNKCGLRVKTKQADQASVNSNE